MWSQLVQSGHLHYVPGCLLRPEKSSLTPHCYHVLLLRPSQGKCPLADRVKMLETKQHLQLDTQQRVNPVTQEAALPFDSCDRVDGSSHRTVFSLWERFWSVQCGRFCPWVGFCSVMQYISAATVKCSNEKDPKAKETFIAKRGSRDIHKNKQLVWGTGG